jgi:hypothetical protein
MAMRPQTARRVEGLHHLSERQIEIEAKHQDGAMVDGQIAEPSLELVALHHPHGQVLDDRRVRVV